MLRRLTVMACVALMVLGLGVGAATRATFAGDGVATDAPTSLSTSGDERRSLETGRAPVASAAPRFVESQRGLLLAAIVAALVFLVARALPARRGGPPLADRAPREHRLGSRRRGPPLPA